MEYKVKRNFTYPKLFSGSIGGTRTLYSGDILDKEMDKGILENTAYLSYLLEEGYIEEIKEELPKSWEELGEVEGYYMQGDSCIVEVGRIDHIEKTPSNRNIFATENQAKGVLAMAQLSQLMKVYNGDWVVDWEDQNQVKFTIYKKKDLITRGDGCVFSDFLAFKSEEIRDLFLENFRDLVEEYFLIYR